MAGSIENIILGWFVDFGWADNSKNLAFESPEWLWLILLWPILWLFSLLLARQGAAKDDLNAIRSHAQVTAKHNLIHLTQNTSASGKTFRVGILTDVGYQFGRGLIIFILAIALANPTEQLPTPSKPETKTVRDIVFVIESSASFLLPDYEVNGQPETRMNVVKQVLDDFISKLDGNRFAITIYADKAYNLLPITFDQTLARLSLKRLKPYLAGRNDMAMGEALGLALKQTDASITLNQSKSVETENTGRKKVLVLISDGLTLPSRLELSEAVNYAQLLGVPIYTIGIGSNSEKADKREFSGLLYQPIESESLKQIATQTQAHYYQVGSGEQISTVLQQINRAEGVPYTTPPAPPKIRSLAHYPLVLAAMVFGLYWLMSLFLILIYRGLSRRGIQSTSDNVGDE